MMGFLRAGSAMTEQRSTDGKERLRLGATEYIWRDGQLQDTQGRSIPLRAKSLSMFAVLLAERGQVLSKDRLSEIVWPGSVATDESIARCISDIRKVLHDDAHKIVQTFPKQGYRLNVMEVSGDDPAPKRAGRFAIIGMAALCALAALALGRMILDKADDDLAVASQPILRAAVAILHIEAENEADRFLAAGLADDLEIHLAEMSGIKMISQTQSTAIEAASENTIAMARSFDARYLVHGSVRNSGDEVALSLRLIDGADGTTLWADRYEGSRAGLMVFRSELPDTLVEVMSIELNARDRRRLAIQDTTDPVAFEEVLRARQELGKFTYEGSLAAERHLRRAIALDPNYARAYADLAGAFAIRMENDWIVISSADTDKAFYFAEKALKLDPDLWFAHYAMGRLHSVAEGGDIEIAFSHLRKAMALQPANDDPRVYYAIARALSGRLEEAAAIFESVMATHPQPPFWYHLGQANVFFHQRRYAEAERVMSTCLEQMPTSPYCLRIQIAILARLGRLEDATWMLEEYVVLGYDTTLDGLMKSAIETDSALWEHLRQSYKLAGIE